MTALLALLAVAGYQNRDKIAEVLSGRAQGTAGAPPPNNRQASAPGGLGGILGGASAGSVLSGGLRDLIERFRQSGHGGTADSWVSTGPNQQLRADQLEQAVGPETLDTLAQHTGLSREELLSRLTRDLPAAVDKFTPAGHLPTEEEAARLV
jgi:uncharacterized protein YidB (DUF937 family)